MAKLNNKKINEILRAAYRDATPDKIEDIIGRSEEIDRAPTFMIEQQNRRYYYLKRAAAIAAAIIILAGVIIALTAFRANQPYATVTIENDECVEITLSSDLRPLGVTGRNSAAIRIARQVAAGENIGDAIDSTLNTMLDSGHLSENSNTVLITVDAPQNSKELLDRSFDAALESFRDSGFNCAILTTVASDDRDVARIARRNRISVGKAEMVRDIVRGDSTLSIDTLSRLSVNDLNVLSFYKNIGYGDIGVFGTSHGCIPPKTAISFVTEDIGDTTADVSAVLSVDAGRLIYSVTVHSSDQVYIYRLNASNGEILAISQGGDLKTAQMVDKNTPTPSPTEKDPEPAAGAAEAAYTPLTVLTSEMSDSTVTATQTEKPSTSPTIKKEEKKNPAPTTANKAKKKTSPAVPKTSEPTAAQPTTQKPTTAPAPTEAPTQKPTTPPQKQQPSAYTAGNYIQSSGIQSKPPTSAKRQISIKRILNGYDTFYNSVNFPYSPSGKQDSIGALVCNTEQLRRLIGKSDGRFDDSYFKSHVLYIYMNRDVSYHWIKSIEAAYTDGGTLYLKNSDPVGYYINTGADSPERIYTVVYEMNKSDLSDFVNMLEYTD